MHALYDTLRPWLFKLDAEKAHAVTLWSMGVAQRGRFARIVAEPPEDFPVRAFGIDFPNPVGLAAGLDKNGTHIDALAALGFGFIEVGTVTPWPQPGNPRPRLFRLPEHEAIINRMGFNNYGVDALVRNIERASYGGVLGINIGKNKDTPNERAVNDYLFCLERVYAPASYITVNISSPNTEGLRDLQQGESLTRLVGTLREAQEKLASQHGTRKPMLLKIAPDLDEAGLDALAVVMLRAHVDGVICTNTTIARDGVAGSPRGDETGGLSGAPLRAHANAVLRHMAERLHGHVPVIGVGGILEGDHAVQKLEAGATLVQVYSGLIYRGPHLVRECVEEIRRQREDTE